MTIKSQTPAGELLWRGIRIPQAVRLTPIGNGKQRVIPVFIGHDPVHVLPGGTWVQDLHGKAVVISSQDE